MAIETLVERRNLMIGSLVLGRFATGSYAALASLQSRADGQGVVSALRQATADAAEPLGLYEVLGAEVTAESLFMAGNIRISGPTRPWTAGSTR